MKGSCRTLESRRHRSGTVQENREDRQEEKKQHERQTEHGQAIVREPPHRVTPQGSLAPGELSFRRFLEYVCGCHRGPCLLHSAAEADARIEHGVKHVGDDIGEPHKKAMRNISAMIIG